MTNAEIGRTLEQLADLSEIDGDNHFKVRAYRNAAGLLRGLDRQVADLLEDGFDLTSLKGIGKEIAEKVGVMVRTGSLPQLTDLARRIPLGLLDVIKIKGVGAKQAATLWRTLGVGDVAALEAALADGRVATLPGFGDKTAQRLAKAIAAYHRNSGRMPLGSVDAVIQPLLARLAAVPGVGRLEVAGSYRRRRDSVGDVDLVASAGDPALLAVALTGYDEVSDVLGSGATKTSVVLHNGLQIDLRVIDPDSFGAALLYFTGSKDHNVALRQRSLERGWHLNEYGLFDGGEPGKDRLGGTRVAGADEAEIYARLDLDYIAPVLREDRGEVAAAAAHNLPVLVTLADMRGDLHLHTTWSDGKNSVVEMVDACAARGYEYMAITDHSGSLALQQGLDEEKLARQHAELDEVLANRQDITVLRGMEVDILKDGTLDLSDEWLERLDIVLVSVHSFFDLSQAEQTARVVAAVSHPQVNVLAHPTGRLIARRDPIDLDLEAVFEACLANGVSVEHNAASKRLDLSDVHLMTAVRHGLDVVINTDAHSTGGLGSMALGMDQAGRAWLRPADVVNTLPLAALKSRLAKVTARAT
ncbi:MAG TPA: DNA polymerase/3'-5' exonuclease PolX [Trueperaceae bacterium]|nr:DNA polymerase/3'-5' exonuclease PolX [Trueperaceae bacterium]